MTTRCSIFIDGTDEAAILRIGSTVSSLLRLPLYHKEIDHLASQLSGIELWHFSHTKAPSSPLYSYNEGLPFWLPTADRVHLARFQAIKEIVQKGPCILVGTTLHPDIPALKIFVGDKTNRSHTWDLTFDQRGITAQQAGTLITTFVAMKAGTDS